MQKTFLLFAALCSLFFTACSDSAPTAPENKPAAPAAAAPTPVPDISYGAGFSDMESAPDGHTWRWMAEAGTIKLKNKHAEMRLKLAGDVPVDPYKGPVKITFKFNGEPLGEFVTTADQRKFEKEFAIPVAKQGSGDFSELTIQSDKFFIPKEVDKNATDERKLSFSLTKLEWAAK